jgi:hypothetical protein
MKALAKATSAVLLVAATAPFSVLALGALEGCDKFKKGGEADAAPEAAPVASDTASAAPDVVDAGVAPIAPVWHKPVVHDGGAVDAGTVKLADGGAAPIPTPIPTPMPSGAPTLTVPTAIPTTLPSNFPKGIPSTIPTNLKLPPPK